MGIRFAAAVAASLALGAGVPAQAADLIHSFDFSSANGGFVNDLVGAASGALIGNAHIEGGAVVFDGDGDAVQFGSQLVPFADDFSVFLRVQIPTQVRGVTEIISQGSSGGAGFYIGSYGTGFRLGDHYYNPGLTFPSDGAYYNLFMTNSDAGFTFNINGTEVFSASRAPFGGGCNTRLGDQFCGAYSEWFTGRIDTFKVYRGVATYAQATGSGAPEPSAWAMMIGGFAAAGSLLRRRRPASA